MSQEKIDTETLIDLYCMAKLYSEEHIMVERQEDAIRQVETIIENNSGYKK